jgi:hypothetical protein
MGVVNLLRERKPQNYDVAAANDDDSEDEAMEVDTIVSREDDSKWKRTKNRNPQPKHSSNNVKTTTTTSTNGHCK